MISIVSQTARFKTASAFICTNQYTGFANFFSYMIQIFICHMLVVVKITFYVLMAFIAGPVHGISYEYLSDGYFTSIHILRVDPNEYLIVPAKAGTDRNRETVTALANRYGAIAAVNGGFWKLNGDPAGILKLIINGMGRLSNREELLDGRGMGKKY